MINSIQIKRLSRKNTEKSRKTTQGVLNVDTFFALKTEMENGVCLDFTTRSAQFLDKDEQNKEKDWLNQTNCTAQRLFCELVLPVPGMNILLFSTECAKYRWIDINRSAALVSSTFEDDWSWFIPTVSISQQPLRTVLF